MATTVSLRQEDINLRFAQAVKFVWAMKSANKEVTKSYVSSTFNIGSNYARAILDNITGQETDLETLTEDVRKKARDFNREINASYKEQAAEPTTEQPERKVIKQDVSRLDVAKDILLAMINGYKETTPEELVERAVKTADLLLEKVEE